MDLFTNTSITRFFEDSAHIAEFLFENLIDLILGAIAFISKASVEAVKLFPYIIDIVEYLVTLAEYATELATVYWRIPVLVLTLTPMYWMIYFLIRSINTLFRG